MILTLILNVVFFITSTSKTRIFSFMICLFAVLSSYMIYKRIKWIVMCDFFFILMYSGVAAYNHIYMGVFTKAFILLPMNLYYMYVVFAPHSITWWRERLRKERKARDKLLCPTKYYTYLFIILFFSYTLSYILNRIGNKHTELVIMSAVTSICATYLHIKHSNNKWVFWIIYNVVVTYIWLLQYPDWNIILYSTFFTIVSILGMTEHLLNRCNKDWTPLFSVTTKTTTLEVRKEYINRRNHNTK